MPPQSSEGITPVRLSALICLSLALAVPAAAQQPSWVLFEDTDEYGDYVAAYVPDVTNSYELEFFCDDEYPDDIALSVFTPVPYTKTKDPLVELTVAVGERSNGPLDAEYMDFDGSLGLQVWEYDYPIIRRIVREAMVGNGVIQVDYADTQVTFPLDGAQSVLRDFLAFCDY